jgi:hypothetical protein
MRFAIKNWVTANDAPRSAALFGVVDADNPGTLPVPSGDGHWKDVKIVDELGFHKATDAHSVIAKQGYYLFGPDTEVSALTRN